jgi:hypothetical protein
MITIRRATTWVAGTIAFAIAAAPLLTTTLVNIRPKDTQPNFYVPSGTDNGDSASTSQYLKERQEALADAIKDVGGGMKQACSSAGWTAPCQNAGRQATRPRLITRQRPPS